MAKFTVTIVEELPKEKDLTSPSVEATYEVDCLDLDHERAKLAYFEKNFEKRMRKVLKEQIKGFAVPLKSMQKDIDKIKKDFNKISSTSLADLPKKTQELTKLNKKLEDTITEYNDYLKKAAVNTAKQQLLIHAEKFEKEAEAAAKKKIKSDIRWKKFRHVAGAVIRGTLVLGVAAAAIAVTIVTLGTATPIIAGLLIGFGAVGGVSALAKTAVDVKGKWNLEKRALKNLESDLNDVSIHLGKVQSKVSGLPKHLDDASRLFTERQALMKKLRLTMTDLDAKITEHSTAMNKLDSAVDIKALEDIRKKIKKLKDKQESAKKSLKSAKERDVKMKQVFADAKKVVGDLTDIPFTGSRSVLDSLERYRNLDTLLAGLDLVSAVGTVATTGVKG